jgi:co-chaperonin GroES (HSP10)
MLKQDFLPNHKPLGDNLIVRRENKSLETKGGILLHDAFTEESHIGVVVAVGAGKNGNMPVKVSDKVVLARHAFQRNNMIKIEGDDREYCKINLNDDVLAILEEGE